MIQLFIEGGALFMGILTIILFVVLALSAKAFIHLGRQENLSTDKISTYIKSVGLFGLVVGILGQLIGLYEAFFVIQQLGGVSPGLLAGGLRVSMITTLYGVCIYIVAHLIWFALKSVNKKSVENMG